MNLINNLKMSRKFALLGLLALAMTLPAVGLLVVAKSDALTAANAEVAGIEPAGDLLKLVQLTQQHRGMSALFLNGNTEIAAARSAKQAEVDVALAKVLSSTMAYTDRDASARREAVKTAWPTLSSDVAGKAIAGPKSFARHSALVAEQLGLLEEVIEASTMLFDPDKANSQAVDAVLVHLPLLTEELGKARAQGAGVLASGEIKPEDRVRLQLAVTAVAAHFDGARTALAKASAVNPRIAEVLQPAVAKAGSAVGEASKLISEQIVAADKPGYASSEYFKVMTRAIDVQFDTIGLGFQVLKSNIEESAAAARRALWTLVLSSLAAAGVGLWVMVSITRNTTRTVTQVLGAAEALAQGDLSHPIHSDNKDEIGQMAQALGAAMTHLSQVVGEIKVSTEAVAGASDEIAKGTLDLSSRTEEQASSLEQTAASMEQMNAAVKSNAEVAHEANRLAASASEVAVNSGAVVQQVVATMDGIQSSSHKIVDIINVIDGIAFQTNILALNAAVEAARAGEQGRGFAVVASEVRSLAGRSAAAAREIKSLITDSVDKVDSGSKLVHEAGTTMQDVVQRVKSVSDLIGEITTASAEQTAGINQVGQAVTELDKVTQQNAALVEQSSAAADSLKEQSAHLAQVVAKFKIAA